jgi:nucleoside-diphosphate-sugar epimerase
MKVLVTGATGFIGNHVISSLLARKMEIVATANDKGKAVKREWFSQVKFVQHDISQADQENLYEKFHCPDIAIHLAWPGLSNFKDPDHTAVFLPAQERFLRQLIAEGLRDLTVTGTCLEYGLREGELDEEMPAQPVISYPIAKNRLRLELESFRNDIPFSLKWVRLFYMFGKGQSEKSILSQLDAALEKGESTFNMSEGDQLRDYLPVETVAENIVIFALQKKIEGIINCCSGKPITIKQLVLDHLRRKNKHIHLNTGFYAYPDYEPFKFWGNNQKQNKIKSL